MKRLLWFLILSVGMSLSVSAALSELPIGSTNKVVEYNIRNTDIIYFGVGLDEDAPRGLWHYVTTHKKEDGTIESVNVLANRSRAELSKFVSETLQKVIASKIELTNLALEGKTFYRARLAPSASKPKP